MILKLPILCPLCDACESVEYSSRPSHLPIEIQVLYCGNCNQEFVVLCVDELVDLLKKRSHG